MTRLLIALCLSCCFTLACSEPQCGANQKRIGSTCRRLPNPDGGDTEEDPGASTASDARVDAKSQPDAQSFDAGAAAEDAARSDASGEDANVGAQADSGFSEQTDASSAEPPPDMTPAMTPSAVCGDGVLNGAELCDPKIAAGQPGACPSADSCKSDKGCLVVKLAGEASACNARCETETLRACANGDDCCPEGCTSGTDNNCSAKCGNGFVDPGETCESGVGAGCPTACPAPTGCSAFMLTGNASACSSACAPVTITTPMAGDGCCPAGGTPKNDADCMGCGNGKVESGEACDGNCKTSCEDDGNPCTDDAPVGSPDQCNVTCPASADRKKKAKSTKSDQCCPSAYDSSANATNDPDCAPSCGNNVKEAGELCDGNCPTTCPGDGIACTSDDVQGTGCGRTCSYPATTTPKVDGCCVAGESYPTEIACPGCGNKIVEGAEQCDDGNATLGDGCGTNCQLDDDRLTAGDDRPGYVVCGSQSCSGVVCSSGPKVTSPGMTQYVNQCGDSNDFAGLVVYTICDGPEDCPPDHKCAVSVDTFDSFCERVPVAELDTVYCHRDTDCLAGQRCLPKGPTTEVGRCLTAQ